VLGANGAAGIADAFTLQTCGNGRCEPEYDEDCASCSEDCSIDADGDGDVDLRDLRQILNSFRGPRG